MQKKKSNTGNGPNKPYRQLILMNLLPELQNLTALATLFKPYGKVYSIKLMEATDFSTISVAWKQHLGLQLATAGHGAIVEFETARAAKFCCGVLRKRVYEQNFRVAVIKPGAEQELEQQYSILHAARNGIPIEGSPNGSENGNEEDQAREQYAAAMQAANATYHQQAQKMYVAGQDGSPGGIPAQYLASHQDLAAAGAAAEAQKTQKRFMREKKTSRNEQNRTSSDSNSERNEMYGSSTPRHRRSLYGVSSSHSNIAMSSSARNQMREEIQALQNGLDNLKRREKNATNGQAHMDAEGFDFEQQFKYLNRQKEYNAIMANASAELKELNGKANALAGAGEAGAKEVASAAVNAKSIAGDKPMAKIDSAKNLMPPRSKSNLSEKAAGKTKSLNSVVIKLNNGSESDRDEGAGSKNEGHRWGRAQGPGER